MKARGRLWNAQDYRRAIPGRRRAVAYDFESDAETPAPARPPRERRRRRRRGISFWAGFLVLVAIGVGAAAVLFGWSPSDSSDNPSGAASPTDSSSTTTTACLSLPPVHNYKVSDGVNVRPGPGTSFANIGTVEKGFEGLVVCATNGETITGPGGPTNQWVRVVVDNKTGYITAAYVETGPAISDQSVIARCPP